MIGHQREKIVPIAGDNEESAFAGIAQSIKIGGSYRKDRSQLRDFMPLTTQHPGRFRWNIMVEEKPHDLSGPLIWRATKVSISAR